MNIENAKSEDADTQNSNTEYEEVEDTNIVDVYRYDENVTKGNECCAGIVAQIIARISLKR